MNKNYGQTILLISFITFSFPVCVIDIKDKRIPDWSVFPGIIVLSALRFFMFGDSAGEIISDMLTGSLLFIAVRFFTKGNLGLGDVKFAALMGVFNSFPGWFFATATASFFGLIFALTGIFSGKLNRSSKIPFAPFLTAGSIITFFLNLTLLPKIKGFIG